MDTLGPLWTCLHITAKPDLTFPQTSPLPPGTDRMKPASVNRCLNLCIIVLVTAQNSDTTHIGVVY